MTEGKEIQIPIDTLSKEEFQIIERLIKEWGFEEVIKYTWESDKEQKTLNATFLVKEADLPSFAHALFAMGMRTGINKEKEQAIEENELSLLEKRWSRSVREKRTT